MAKRVRILIAGDHSVVRAGLRKLLNISNFRVIAEAKNGEEAVRQAKEHRPDVAILDIRMPGISGIEACRRILEAVPLCRVIILTSYSEDELLMSAIQAGASTFILKRIVDNELVQAVERVSRGEGTLDPAMTTSAFAKVREARQSQYAKAFEVLSAQEVIVLFHLTQAKTNQQIAGEIYLGTGTVRNYVSSILSKLDLSNRAEAAAYAVKNRISEIIEDTGD